MTIRGSVIVPVGRISLVTIPRHFAWSLATRRLEHECANQDIVFALRVANQFFQNPDP